MKNRNPTTINFTRFSASTFRTNIAISPTFVFQRLTCQVHETWQKLVMVNSAGYQ